MLSRYDDYPIHQTPEPIAHPATGDRNAYDRYWFNGFDRDGEFYFGIALCVYPNRRIMDASLSIVRDGQQHALHVSRLAPDERTDTQVGPLKLEVVEPMKRLRVTVDPNETGIECQLEFAANTAAVEEQRTVMRRNSRVMMDSTRFTQFGTWSGHVLADGQRTEVRPERVCATRDRSWGVRPVGEPEGGAPGGAPQIFFLWNPVQFDDFCTHALTFEHSDGSAWAQEAMIVPKYPSTEDIPAVSAEVEHLSTLRHQVVYEPGTRRASSAALELGAGDGARRIELEPILRFQMMGIGYTNPEWGHGVWKGENAIGAESWKLDDLDPSAFQHQHIQQVVRARLGEHQGVGVLEQLCFGPYEPYGLTGILDPAT